MKKTLLLIATISCGLTFGQSTGDIAFIGFNADGDDDLAFVVLSDIAASTTIYITDNEWSGTAFVDQNEGELEWSHTSTVNAGTVIVLSDISGSASTNIGTIGGTSVNLNASDEVVYAFVGTDNNTPTTFLAAISNDVSASDNPTTGTSLVEGTTFIDFNNDSDGFYYSGSRSGESDFSDYLTLVNNTSNWTDEGGSGENILPISTTSFSLAGSTTVGFDEASSSEEETDVTFSISIPVTLGNYSGSQVDLNVTVDGASTAESGDYTLNTSSLSFTSSTTQNISLSINDDDDDDNETVILNITETTSTGVTITTSQHTVSIADDEIPLLVISEIMYNTPSTDDEWIEIYNANGSSVDVSNWTIELGGSTEFTFPASTTLTAESYSTIALGSNGDGTFNNDNPFTPDFNSLGVANSSVASESNSNNLSNSSATTITLKTDGGSTVDEVEYNSSDQSETNGDGPSYEIIELDVDNNATSSNWQASPVNGGSPGEASNVVVWDGSSSSNWDVDANWKNDVKPTSTDNVIITTDGTDPVIAAETEASCNDLTINSSATLTVSSGGSLAIFDEVTNNGTYTVEKAVTGSAGISFLGAPVSDATIADMTDADYIHGYSNSTDSWSTPSGASAMTAGVGFSVGHDDASPTVSFSGTPNSDDVTYSVSETSGFELVSNPYAAAIDVADFLADNTIITGGAYLWDDGGSNVSGNRGGDYISVTAMGSASSVEPDGTSDGVAGSTGSTPADDGYIASVQGFFVEVNNSGTITFSPEHQVFADGSNDESDHYRRVEYQKVKLAIEGNDLYNEILIGLGEGATFGVDRILDAKKFVTDNPLSFYSLLGEEKYVIQALPMARIDDVTAKLGFDLAEAGDYTLKVVSMENIPSYLDVRIIDHDIKKVYPLDEYTEVPFRSEVVQGDDRFELVFSSSILSAPEEEVSSITVFGTRSEINIQAAAEGASQVSIFTLDGRVFFKEEIDFVNNSARISTSLDQNQVYILRVNDESVKFSIQ